MADLIKITIVRGCDEDGRGGDIIDESGAVLGLMPDGKTPIINGITAAFVDAYGIYSYPDPENLGETITVTPFRNVAYCVRQFVTEIFKSWAAKQAAAQAATQARQQVDTVLATVKIVE